MRLAAEVLRGGPGHSNWTELRTLAEDLAAFGEWEQVVPRWALALKDRLAEAARTATDGASIAASGFSLDAGEDKQDRQQMEEQGIPACIGHSRCYGHSVFLDIASMRRQYTAALVHTGAPSTALVQSILAVRAEQMAQAAATGTGVGAKRRTLDAETVVAELMALPSHGWHDGQVVLDSIRRSQSVDTAARTADSTSSDSANADSDVVYRTHEQHDALFPMGFVHDLVRRRGDRFGSRSAQPDDVVGAVRSSSVLPTQRMFATVLAPGAASGATLPGCHRTVRKLCGLDLAAVEEDEYTRTKTAQTLLACVEHHCEDLEVQCLMRGVGEPLLLRGAARRLPAYKRWRSDTAIDRKYGEQILQTVEQEKVARRSTPSISMTISEFLQRYDRNASNDQLYAITMLPAAMRPDVEPLDRGGEMGLLPDGSMSTGPRLWFSSGSTTSVLHKDMLDNMNCVIAGSKHVAIVHPRLNDVVEKEQWEQLEWLEAVVREGDCLFIPAGWYHQVTTPKGRSIAANTFFQRADS